MRNSDRRHFLRTSLLTLGAVGIAGAALAADPEPKPKKVYVCPPCGCAADGKEFPDPGNCPECGMTLIGKPAPPT
jgi:rubrerythrin